MKRTVSLMIIVAIVACFPLVGTALAENFAKTLVGQEFVAQTGGGSHGLVRFDENGYVYYGSSKKPAFQYTFLANNLVSFKNKKVFKNKEGMIICYLVRKNGGAKISAIIESSDILFQNFFPVPKGYPVLLKALASSERVFLKQAKKSLKNAEELDPFIRDQYCQGLARAKFYKEAKKGFASAGDAKGVAMCNVMLTAKTGRVPSGVDINTALKIFWNHHRERGSFKEIILRAEIISHVCSLVGNEGQAMQYIKNTHQWVKKNARKIKGSRTILQRLNRNFEAYRRGNSPPRSDLRIHEI